MTDAISINEQTITVSHAFLTDCLRTFCGKAKFLISQPVERKGLRQKTSGANVLSSTILTSCQVRHNEP